MSILEIKEQLEAPFDVELIEMLPQSIMNDKGLALAYVDVNEYKRRLNKVAYGEWGEDSLVVTPMGEQVIVSLLVTICGVSRTGISDPDKPTSAYAQAFKRACASFGMGLYLYSMPQRRYPVQNKRFVDSNLSIAIEYYDAVGLSVPEESRKKLNGKASGDTHQGNNGYKQPNGNTPQQSNGKKWPVSDGRKPHLIKQFKFTKEQVNDVNFIDNDTAKDMLELIWNKDENEKKSAAEVLAMPKYAHLKQTTPATDDDTF